MWNFLLNAAPGAFNQKRQNTINESINIKQICNVVLFPRFIIMFHTNESIKVTVFVRNIEVCMPASGMKYTFIHAYKNHKDGIVPKM